MAGFVLLFSSSLKLTYCIVFAMGMAMAPRVFVTYVHIMEMLPKSKTAIATSVNFGIDGLVLTWASLYFMLIDNNWRTFYSIVAVTTLMAVIAAYQLPESPKYLVGKGKYDQARKVITKIARVNKIDKFECRDDELVPQEKSDGKVVYRCLFEEEIIAN